MKKTKNYWQLYDRDDYILYPGEAIDDFDSLAYSHGDEEGIDGHPINRTHTVPINGRPSIKIHKTTLLNNWDRELRKFEPKEIYKKPVRKKHIKNVTNHHNVNNDFPETNFIQKHLFDKDECDKILKMWDEDNPEILDIGINPIGKFTGIKPTVKKKIHRIDEDWRKCDIRWVKQRDPNWKWVFEKIFTKINEINDKYYKFDIGPQGDSHNSMQYTKYGPGGVYIPHLDWAANGLFQLRKLSFSVNLSDEDSYVAGGLSVSHNPPKKEIKPTQGNIIVFPSFIRHQALPVISGERYALIGWMLGKPFK